MDPAPLIVRFALSNMRVQGDRTTSSSDEFVRCDNRRRVAIFTDRNPPKSALTPPAEPARDTPPLICHPLWSSSDLNIIRVASPYCDVTEDRRDGPTGRDADTAIGRGDAGKLDRIGLIDFDRTAGSGGQVSTGNRRVQSDRTTGCGRQLIRRHLHQVATVRR